MRSPTRTRSPTSRCRPTTWPGWPGFNREENRLGVAVQLATLPWLGWIPDDLANCPVGALTRVARAMAIDPAAASVLLTAYGGWQGETRRKHRAQVLGRLGWRWCGSGERKLLDEFLLARALEHDAPGVLLQLACDWMRAGRIVRPSVDTLTRRIASARDAARAEAYQRLGPLLAPPRPVQLDGLLDVDPDLDVTRLAWLRRGATAATPEVLEAELDKLEFLRRHGADRLDLSRLPAGRRRMLAEIGRRSTNQALQRADVDRRPPRSLLRPPRPRPAPPLDDQVDQALCLTLVTNASVLWTSTYLGDALDALRDKGAAVSEELAAHLTPAQHDHINFYGTYSFDVDSEVRRDRRRPLRVTA